MEDIKLKNGNPYPTIQSARAAVSYFLSNDNIKYIPVEIEGGFGLVLDKGSSVNTNEENVIGGSTGVDNILYDIKANETDDIADINIQKDEPTRRPPRVPIVKRNVLTAPKKKGFVRRFVNIDENREGWDRVREFMEAGYKVVEGDVQIGDKRIVAESQLGKAVIRNVGHGVKAILMEQRQDWYDEDQKERDERNKKITSVEIAKARSGLDGDIFVENGPMRY